MKIEIILKDENGEIIAKRIAINSFETAEENLGKLERYWKMKEQLERAEKTAKESGYHLY